MATESKTLDYYLALPYEVLIKHDEDGWFARVPDLPGCMTWADTYEELGPMIEDAKRGWIEDAIEHGDSVPEPRAASLESYSGKVNLRMPRSVHRDLARRAEREGVSLNQLMVATLARSVGPDLRDKSERWLHSFTQQAILYRNEEHIAAADEEWRRRGRPDVVPREREKYGPKD